MVIRNGVNHVLRALPLFVALEILGHVVKVILFLGRRQFKDAFGFRDQYLGSLNFFPRASFMLVPVVVLLRTSVTS